MSIATLVIALIVIVVAWKVLTGMIKVGAILAVVIGTAYLLSQGNM